MNIEIRDEREDGHYVAYLDSKRLGYATWLKVHDTVVLPHTEVDSEWAGRGIGSMLARRAFEDARADGLTVLPFCPFMKRWAELHPEFRDVVRAVRPGEVLSVERAVRAVRTLESLAQSAGAQHSPGNRSAASEPADTQGATSATEAQAEAEAEPQAETQAQAETRTEARTES